jgi:hypothetical protein
VFDNEETPCAFTRPTIPRDWHVHGTRGARGSAARAAPTSPMLLQPVYEAGARWLASINWAFHAQVATWPRGHVAAAALREVLHGAVSEPAL